MPIVETTCAFSVEVKISYYVMTYKGFGRLDFGVSLVYISAMYLDGPRNPSKYTGLLTEI